jgi:hypothetical protein
MSSLQGRKNSFVKNHYAYPGGNENHTQPVPMLN